MRLLDYEDLRAKGIKYSKCHLWRKIKSGEFPKPKKLFGPNGKNVWTEEVIDRHIAQLATREEA